MHSDPIADLLTRIRNGAMADKDAVQVPHSKLKEQICRILQEEGYIAGYEVTTESRFPTLNVRLRYVGRRRPVIRQIRRVSKPGLRIYKGADDLKPLKSGLATRIVSTSQGLMTDREARKRRIGGEVLCEVW
ncbi:MAG TPA: 30S ribosomal protein S8 [Armatimonadetes bacterium]|jgi:small subunit ribosomal protein S8|nr:30S ribosomal protein S8 [Armatimonadota bacterium]MCA1996658.1 30S ribosomal protein S8 [Armatimonadota bacterium]HCD99461.1 30S ribosomal protein S8 [Armatimonadota bacterium]